MLKIPGRDPVKLRGSDAYVVDEALCRLADAGRPSKALVPLDVPVMETPRWNPLAPGLSPTVGQQPQYMTRENKALRYGPHQDSMPDDALRDDRGRPVCHFTSAFGRTGMPEEGQVRGSGTWAFQSGGTWTGHWEGTLPNGDGDARYPTGASVKGRWRDGKLEGSAQWNTRQGIDTQGMFAASKLHGRGVIKYPTGASYDGQFMHGNKHGQGVYRGCSGHVYKGLWRNGLINGYGVLSFPDGSHVRRTWTGVTFKAAVLTVLNERKARTAFAVERMTELLRVRRKWELREQVARVRDEVQRKKETAIREDLDNRRMVHNMIKAEARKKKEEEKQELSRQYNISSDEFTSSDDEQDRGRGGDDKASANDAAGRDTGPGSDSGNPAATPSTLVQQAKRAAAVKKALARMTKAPEAAAPEPLPLTAADFDAPPSPGEDVSPATPAVGGFLPSVGSRFRDKFWGKDKRQYFVPELHGGYGPPKEPDTSTEDRFAASDGFVPYISNERLTEQARRDAGLSTDQPTLAEGIGPNKLLVKRLDEHGNAVTDVFTLK